jgi:carboxypeptidase C (cathepsin A)
MKLKILNYRNFALSMLVFLAACDDPQSHDAASPSAKPAVSNATFATPAAATPKQASTSTIVIAKPAADETAKNAQPAPAAFVWPADNAVVDSNHYFEAQDPDALNSVAYKSGPNGGEGDSAGDIALAGLDPGEVDETPSSKHHQLIVNNQTIDYTARAGHLIAKAPVDPANPQAARDAEGSIFYMSYTRDDVPADKRPVTFFFNGGPGEPSIWLHLGSWAPKHLEVNAPDLPDGSDMPDSFPLVDNPQTLLDQTDMVFVDIVGSGLSQAIKPHKNSDFWNTNSDAQIFRDFITAYINRYNRQSSPKYLYGESYSGIRAPIVSDLLVKAGTSQYEPDPSGKPAVVLSGFVLQAPVLDYAGSGGSLPTFGMTADYYGKGTARGAMSEADYADYLRSFTTWQYRPVLDGSQTASDRFNLTLSAITGIPASNFGGSLYFFEYFFTDFFGEILYPDSQSFSFNAYDLRTSKDTDLTYDISFYEDAGFYGAIKPYLLEEFNYSNKAATQLYGADVAFSTWNHNHTEGGKDTSVPDLVEALALAPELRAMVVHGYHDTVCPFYQSEVDLLSGGALPQFKDRITIKDYDGGHMTYLTPASHVAIRADLRDFYQAPKTVASIATTSVAAR